MMNNELREIILTIFKYQMKKNELNLKKWFWYSKSSLNKLFDFQNNLIFEIMQLNDFAQLWSHIKGIGCPQGIFFYYWR